MPQIIVVGAGNWGKNIIKNVFDLGHLAGIVELNPSLSRNMIELYPDIPIYQDVSETVNLGKFTYMIATPAQTHYEIAKKLLSLGRDVFVEKPLTLKSSESKELVEIAEDKGSILMVGHLLLYQPAIQKIKDAINAGSIGKLKTIHQKRLKLGKVRSFENVLWSFGVHDLAVFYYLTGSEVVDFNNVGQAIIQDNIEDDIHLHLTFASGVRAHLHVSWLYPKVERELVIIGTEGMIAYDEIEGKVYLHKKKILNNLDHVDEGVELIAIADPNPLLNQCVHCIECVSDRICPIADGYNGLQVVELLEKISRK